MDLPPAVSATTKRLKGRYGVEHDLGIQGGAVVTSRDRVRANVYVDGGRIAAVTGSRMVDAHVHFMDPGQPEREDFTSGSAAGERRGRSVHWRWPAG